MSQPSNDTLSTGRILLSHHISHMFRVQNFPTLFLMNIVFVCTANVSRSVMAQAIMQRLLLKSNEPIRVSSAGLEADSSGGPDRLTIRVCSDNGLDVSTHRSIQLTAAILEKADLVLCLGENHKRIILGAYPGLQNKVFLLKEYGSRTVHGNPSVDDPIGKRKSTYDRCFEEIQREIKRIVPLLTRHEP